VKGGSKAGHGVLLLFTLGDPTIGTRTWTAAVPLTGTDGPMYEYACHEGNARRVEGIVRGARVQDTNPR
jgi:hypothetical protein